MVAKLLNLLGPLKNKATILRVGLAGVVLGVGGFAVYKGVQQMKPSRPTPKRTETAANKLTQHDDDDLDPTKKMASLPIRVLSAQSPDGAAPAETLYGSQQYNPAAAGQGNLYSSGDQTSEGQEGTQGGIPPSPLQGYAVASDEQPSTTSEGSRTQAAVPNRLRTRPPTTVGTHQISDDAGTQAAAGVYGQAGTEAVGSGQEGSAYGAVGDGSQEAPATESTTMSEGTYGDDAQSETAPSHHAGVLQPPHTLPGVNSRRGQNHQTSAGVLAGSALRHLGGGDPRASADEAAASSGAGVPGDRQFEGTQVPSIAIEKFAPAEIQVGKPATFEIRVRNAGQVAAHDVVVTDQVPRGTKLEATSPQAQVAADGSLAWQIGAMQPGDEMVLSMQVLPEEEGEIGSVAQVMFAGRATARSVCTRPLLAIEHTAPKQVLIGETVRLAITITNPGTGAATGVIVEEDVPAGLTHVAGGELEYEIGTLRPGETRQLELQLTADKAGVIDNLVTVRGEGNLIAQHKVQIEVIAPQLEVAVSGPKRRYLDRQATYTLSIANPGTAAARTVQLAAYLPKGMKFFSTDAEGQYDAAQHAVFWSLEELPANKSGSVKLVAVPVETGEQRLRVEGKADLGLTAANEQVVQVEAGSDLVFNIVDANDPIEVGTDTTYEIRVANKGTRPATNVEVLAGFPTKGELKPVSADGHARGTVRGQQVTFEPVGRINPGEEAVFRIQAQGAAEGDHVIAVQIRSAEFPTPVTREESTRVYVDR